MHADADLHLAPANSINSSEACSSIGPLIVSPCVADET